MKIKSDVLAKIKERVLKQLDVNEAMTRNIYIDNERLPAGKVLAAGHQRIKLSRDTALVFEDLAPLYNWGHPCRYVLHDPDMGDPYDSVRSEFPPNLKEPRESFQIFHEPVKQINWMKEKLKKPAVAGRLTNALTNALGTRYAVLFSGASNNRHINDLEFLYRTLIDVYGFNAANIYVLNYDGTIDYSGGPHPVGNWPGDNTAYRIVVNGQGTKAAFENILDTLKANLKLDDLLFIHMNNHGGHNGTQSYLCTYSGADYLASDFAAKLATLPKFATLVVMMEQCHSGGFVSPIINNTPALATHVAAACREDRSSIGGADFDPFALDWIAAVNGTYADGSGLHLVVDSNGDGRISMSEAFTYADADKDPYDTPVSDDKPDDYGNYIFLGLPAHDLYIRDNLDDTGQEPLVAGGISASPDIIVYNQQLLDPQGTLGTPAAMAQAHLGEPVEKGQDNFIYLRVQNRGANACAGTATVYWCPVSTFPTPGSWNLVNPTPITIPSVSPGGVKIVGPVVWSEADIPATGHYCFVALLNSGSDPAPDPAAISSVEDFHQFIRSSNNATWKNFNVVDMFAGTTNQLDFHIQGWPRSAYSSDLVIDIQELPTPVEVRLRILKRLTEGAALTGLELEEESVLYRRYLIMASDKATIHNMPLKPSDDSQATLEFTLPAEAPDGAYYVSVSQRIGGEEIGRATQMIIVGDHPFVANRNPSSRELHRNSCVWVSLMAPDNKVAYTQLERALKHGYNGCAYCLPEYSTD